MGFLENVTDLDSIPARGELIIVVFALVTTLSAVLSLTQHVVISNDFISIYYVEVNSMIRYKNNKVFDYYIIFN